MTCRIEDIVAFVREETAGRGPIGPRTTLGDLGVEGDDHVDLMQGYAERFGVSLDGYRWYFHHGEEGWNLGALFVRPPHARLPRIEIDMELLRRSAEAGRWLVDYPPHAPPGARPDIAFNRVLALGLGLLLLAALLF
ncbi:DUF1493 family protein [Albimonas sp. CAU 1670]|uniref:DUF1493 family protein n=1 Tax=Albimonas sp. CAU 1670 TaxID=3032599 RepID=UPI0023DB9D70|nr:DUF1493 family protein [Albimonas sp. CAU 1670]MDF2233440.1 DUF1493 family protein [Albimonas sp. CAU 1670]